jgi:hypothetical protein
MSQRFVNPAATALYRRVLRLRRKIEEEPLRRKFIYNVREIFSLYAYPERCFTLPKAPKFNGNTAGANTSESSTSAFSENEGLLSSKMPTLTYKEYIWQFYEPIIREKISNAHKDLDLFEVILDCDPEIRKKVLPSFDNTLLDTASSSPHAQESLINFMPEMEQEEDVDDILQSKRT